MEARSGNAKKQNTEAPQRSRSDVFHVLAPINYLGRVCGLSPVERDHAPHGQTNFPLLVYGVTLALALSSAQCYGLYRDLHYQWQRGTKKVWNVVVASDLLCAIVSTCFAIFDSPSRCKHALQALCKIVQADDKLEFTTTKNLRGSSIILITCSLVYVISISALDYNLWIIEFAELIEEKEHGKGPINYIPFYVMQALLVVLEMEYAVILMQLAERFAMLNSTIEEFIEANSTVDYVGNDADLTAEKLPRRRRRRRRRRRAFSETFVSTDQGPQRRRNRAASSSIEGAIDESAMIIAESIDQLMRAYDLLCDGIVHLNKAFDVQLLICTLNCQLNLVVTLYFVYGKLHGPGMHWCMLMGDMSWIIFHVYKMFLFVQPAHLVTSKARNTGSLVSQALASNWNPQVKKQLERFTIQLLQRPVEFTACGLFYLDRGLMASMIGAATTYLAILVQYQSKSNT